MLELRKQTENLYGIYWNGVRRGHVSISPRGEYTGSIQWEQMEPFDILAKDMGEMEEKLRTALSALPLRKGR